MEINECTCEGSHQFYDCTVDRANSTVWRGTALNCPAINNEIVFQYGAPGAVNTSCNEGAVSGYVIRANDSSYTSRLSIFITPALNGSRVSCFSDGSRGTVKVGSSDLTITTGAIVSLIYLIAINLGDVNTPQHIYRHALHQNVRSYQSCIFTIV